MRRTPRVLARALVVLFAMTGFAGTLVAPAFAADSVPWTVGTAANDLGSNRPNYIYTLSAGGRLDDGLVVANPGPTTLELDVYGADAFTTGTGRLDLFTKATKSTGVGAWVRPGQEHLALQPGESRVVPFTVTVPADATPGDHLGGIVTSLTRDGVERRVGLRIRLRVSGTLQPGLSVDDPRMDYSGTAGGFGQGEATLTYTIRNTGNAIVAARQAASASGPFGIGKVAAGRIPDSPQLLPGEKWQVSVPVQGVTPALRLTGTVTVIPLLTDAVGSIAPLDPVEATAHTWAVPWVLVLLVIVVCAVVATAVVFRRRARPREQTPAQATASRERETADQ